MFPPSEQPHVVGSVCDPLCVKTWSTSWESPREKQEEEAELCSAAVSWQQITEDLKHCLALWQRANRWGVVPVLQFRNKSPKQFLVCVWTVYYIIKSSSPTVVLFIMFLDFCLRFGPSLCCVQTILLDFWYFIRVLAVTTYWFGSLYLHMLQPVFQQLKYHNYKVDILRSVMYQATEYGLALKC